MKNHFRLNNVSFENRTVYEIMWKTIVQPNRSQVTTRGKRIACWILKATNKHSEYVITIVFPLEQRLYELPSILLLHTHTACLVMFADNTHIYIYPEWYLCTSLQALRALLTSIYERKCWKILHSCDRAS
jgi:hypothetical protein